MPRRFQFILLVTIIVAICTPKADGKDACTMKAGEQGCKAPSRCCDNETYCDFLNTCKARAKVGEPCDPDKKQDSVYCQLVHQCNRNTKVCEAFTESSVPDCVAKGSTCQLPAKKLSDYCCSNALSVFGGGSGQSRNTNACDRASNTCECSTHGNLCKSDDDCCTDLKCSAATWSDSGRTCVSL